jgi:pimeloyl-ACP methyl ester carboxylesterase
VSAADSRLALVATTAATRSAGRFSAKLSRRPVARLWFTPWRLPVSDRERRRRALGTGRAERIIVDTRHGKLSGLTAGSGRAILLVHGWGDEAASLGAFFPPLIERGFKVIAVDLPAHGASPGGQTNGYEVAEALVDIEARFGPIHGVVAHSLGGWAAVLALSQGLKAHAVALLAPLVRVEHAVDRFADLFRVPVKAKMALRGEMERRFGSDVWPTLAADLIASDLTVPALIVHDRDDPQVDIQDAELLASNWPDARFETTTGLSHHRIIRNENVVLRVADFLAAKLGAPTAS